MQDLLRVMLAHALGAWRFRWHAVAAAWAGALLGWAIVWMLPNQYVAKARVYIDTGSVLRPLLTGLAVDSDVPGQVTMMSRTLLSRPNLERVARETDLYLRAGTPEKMTELVDSLEMRISLSAAAAPQTPARTNLYSISFIDHDPQMAFKVVNTLLNTFVEDTLGLNREDSSTARQFIEEQIRIYESRLAEAENRLAEFKQRNVGHMPSAQGDYYQRLQTAMGLAAATRTELQLAQSRRDSLQERIEGEVPTFGLMKDAVEESGPVAALKAKREDHKKKLDALLLQYTEKHPGVAALREQIAQLDAQLVEESAKARRGEGQVRMSAQSMTLNSLDINPVFQNMKIALNSAELQVTELREKLRAEDAEVRRLRELMNTIPEVEAELARLNRDYEVNKAQHAELLQRLEAARISQDVEQSKQEAKFRMLDPPAVPLLPEGPNRPLLLSAALVFAAGVGIGIAVLLNTLNPVFSVRHMLREFTPLPVLGSISTFPGLGDAVVRGRRESLLLATAAATLLVAYAAILIILR